jgi:hypothetical protein
MINGRLGRPGLLDRGREQMVLDAYVTAQVWRVVDGEDVKLGAFQTRVAGVSAGEAGRDQQSVQGNTADRLFVALTPLHVDVLKGDEVWIGDDRMRVVAVDKYGHGQQLIMRAIQ